MAKYCGNCGAEVNDNQDVCLKCGSKINGGGVKSETKKVSYCINCGAEISDNQDVCLKCGVKVKKANNSDAKSKIAAGLFGIFFGAFGVHNFYLGYKNKGLTQLLMTVLSCGILGVVTSIWGIVEGIQILCGNITTDADGNSLVD